MLKMDWEHISEQQTSAAAFQNGKSKMQMLNYGIKFLISLYWREFLPLDIDN